MVSISKMSCLKFSIQALVATLLALVLAACGGGGGGGNSPATPSSPVLIPSSTNVHTITVDAGPTGTGPNVNRLYTTVTVCFPGSASTCQTIDHVLVDTGSSGLRLFSSAVATLGLPRLMGNGGNLLLNCAQFVDGTYSWGPVATADVVLGGKIANNVPIQLMADTAFNTAASSCSAGNDAMTTPADMGGNGIIGIGILKEDCGAWCSSHSGNGFYFTCVDSACTSLIGNKTDRAIQVKNPLTLFTGDNNGFIVDLPAVSSSGTASITGSLIFGIGTQANNKFNSGVFLQPNATGNFSTAIGVRTWSAGFIDTGSNGIYFDYPDLAPCGSNTHFYCPSSPLTLSATLTGLNLAPIGVSTMVGNALSMFSSPQKAALPGLAGPIGISQSFDWGLPFFYGRRVFIAIEGEGSVIGTGPMYAF